MTYYWPRGGYPSGDKPVSELKPPPANISKPKVPDKVGALDDVVRLRLDLQDARATIERMGKVGADTINLLTKERDEARDQVNQLIYDRNHPYGETILDTCPDSCGGQSWTGVNTNYGRRWRCDTCHRVISRYVSDAIQAADDRRSL